MSLPTLWLRFVEQRERGTFLKLAGAELGAEEVEVRSPGSPARSYVGLEDPGKGLQVRR